MLAGMLPAEWVAFIDNTAGEAALKKGYGKDCFVKPTCCPPLGDSCTSRLAANLRQGGVQGKRGGRCVQSKLLPGSPRRQRLNLHSERIVNVLVRAACDAQFAAKDAVDELFYMTVL